MKNIQKRKRKNNISYQLFITRYSNFKIIFFWLMGFWSFSGYTQEQDTVILRVKPYHDTVLVTDAQVVVHSGEKDSLILQYSEEEGAYIGEAVVKLLKYRSGRWAHLVITHPKLITLDGVFKVLSEGEISAYLADTSDYTYYSSGGYGDFFTPYTYNPNLLLILLSDKGMEEPEKLHKFLKKYDLACNDSKRAKNTQDLIEGCIQANRFGNWLITETPENIENYLKEINKIADSPYVLQIGHILMQNSSAVHAFSNEICLDLVDSITDEQFEQLLMDYKLEMVRYACSWRNDSDKQLKIWNKSKRVRVKTNYYGHAVCEIVKNLLQNELVEDASHEMIYLGNRNK